MFESFKTKRDEIVHKFLWNLTEKFPDRVRIIKVNDKPYLRRFYITPRINPDKELDDRSYGIYLHYFFMGDEDRELHNHPWDKALSLILCGGYFEEKRDNKTNVVTTHDIKPGTFNFIKSDDFHRVIKKPNSKHIWTLFIVGKRIQEWGFWSKESREYTPFNEFFEKKNKKNV